MQFRPYRQHLAPLSILLLTALLYANTLGHSFVYDDHIVIIGSSLIRSWENLPALVSPDYFVRSGGEFSYRPVVTFTYLIDYSLWGLNPFGYHLTNLLLQMGAGLLLYRFALHLTTDRVLSVVAALLFVSHPVLTETVNAVSFREDLLTGLFVVGGLLLALTGWRGSSVLCYALALFSKEMGITLPLLLLLYDVCFSSTKERKKRIPVYAGYLAMAAGYLVVRFFLLPNPLEAFRPASSGVSERLSLIPRAVLVDLQLMGVPLGLSAEHTVPQSIPSLVAAGAVIFLIVAAGAVYRTDRAMAFSLWWVFLALLPVANLIPLWTPISEHYLYLPTVGASLFLSLLLHRAALCVFATRARQIVSLSACVVIALFSVATVLRNTVWKDDLTLWEDTVRKSPQSSKAHAALASVYWRLGRVDASLQEYDTALKLDPANIYAQMGYEYVAKRKSSTLSLPEGTAQSLLPSPAEVRLGTGQMYARKGHYPL